MAKPGPVGSHYEARRRAEDAMALRSMAYTWQEIADKLGYGDRNSPINAVRRLVERTRRPTIAEQRHESREELRVLRRRLHDHLEVAERDHDAELATKLAREIRANLEASARLDGLNAPQRTEVNVTVNAVDELRRQLLAEINEPPALQSAIDAEVVEG